MTSELQDNVTYIQNIDSQQSKEIKDRIKKDGGNVEEALTKYVRSYLKTGINILNEKIIDKSFNDDNRLLETINNF